MRKTSLGLLVLMTSGCTGAPARSPAPTEAPTIQWHRFGPSAFEQARREGKLILVDAGIEGCTACRWMHEGTYHDGDIARRINRDFVAVSVDADQEPDLGDRFEPWGWPATVFFTPQGQQVYALEGSEGPRPFARLLDEILAKKRANTLKPATGLARADDDGQANLIAACSDANARLEAIADDYGWGGRERVAVAAPFEHALMRARSRSVASLDRRALAVGEGEAKLIDPVWGGVFVAATSETWDHAIPEKRTIHEAAALDTFALALHRTGDPRWKTRADLVRKYLEEWMRAPDGTFYSTQQDEAPALPANMDATAYYRLGDASRRSYGVPAIDHGIYTDQNADVIEAYVRLYEATGDRETLAIAVRAGETLLKRRSRPDGGMEQVDLTPELAEDSRLRAKVIGDRLFLKAQGEMGLALLMLSEATGEERYVDAAREIARALSSLEDAVGGGFFASTPRETDALVARQKPLTDNLTAARFLIRLGAVTRDRAYSEAGKRALTGSMRSCDVRRQGPWNAGLVALVLEELLLGPVEITIVRGGDDARARALHDESVRLYEPRKIVRVEAPGHYPKPRGGASVYVCTLTSCSSPMENIADVRAAVDRMTVVGVDAACSR
jgi:uncharacterized protein